MQRYFSDKKIDNKFILSDNDYYHISRVMRMKDDDNIEVVYNNEVYICKLEFLNNNINVYIIKRINSKNDKLNITLFVPLVKEQKMDLILQKATELGVTNIIPIITSRSIVKVDNIKENKKMERWQKICKEASEQSKRADIPKVLSIIDIKNIEKLDGVNIVCSTTEKDNNIKIFLQNHASCDKINVVIGPEGGLSSTEENILVEKGFIRVSLGSRIMRVETVPIFILSIINYEYME